MQRLVDILSIPPSPPQQKCIAQSILELNSSKSSLCPLGFVNIAIIFPTTKKYLLAPSAEVEQSVCNDIICGTTATSAPTWSVHVLTRWTKMHPDGTAADREGDRSGGDDAAVSRPGPSTSPLLLVTEAAECSNTVRTSTCSSNSSSNNRSSRSTRQANGHLYSSLPLKNSPSKNCRLLKSGPFTPPPQALPPQIRRVLLHCNVNGRKRAAVASSSSCSSSSSTVDESADQQHRGRRRQPPSSSFFGQEPRRRQTKRSTTDQHVRRRLLLITSVISCASLLLFTLITSLIFIRRPFDDVTSTDLNDELGGNDQQLIRKLRGAYSGDQLRRCLA
ncbi:hypothetical protein GPALN_006049 [Globodera pallida]|nr:hypothetical protein GPALN_006049 [Globodera pallida]